jgi:hypothetical protein
MKPLPKYGLVLSGAALVVLGVFSLLRVLPVKAQQSRSVPGSPSATRTVVSSRPRPQSSVASSASAPPSRSHGGPRRWCHLKARPTCC